MEDWIARKNIENLQKQIAEHDAKGEILKDLLAEEKKKLRSVELLDRE